MKILTYAVMFYMTLALIWWTILLTKNNKELLETKLELVDTGMPGYAHKVDEIKAYHQAKANMILGEGLVFGIMLIVGLFVIQRIFNKELESVGRQKNFLLSVTHELKSPLTSVNLITETLQKRDLDKEQRNSLLGNILGENKRLEKLINNLLLSAKLQASYQYNFEVTDLFSNVEPIVARYKNLFPLITLELTGMPGCYVKLDKESFESVVSNLLENAIKYGEPSGKVKVGLKQEGGFAKLEFKDNGCGIPKKEIKKIFDPFYRIGNEETRKTKGTGLGLYIVRQIVLAHGGRIEVADNVPKGTIFNIFIKVVENHHT